MTVGEYLEIERANIGARIRNEKRGSGCVTFGPDLQVGIDQRRTKAYPDVTVVRGGPVFTVGLRTGRGR